MKRTFFWLLLASAGLSLFAQDKEVRVWSNDDGDDFVFEMPGFPEMTPMPAPMAFVPEMDMDDDFLFMSPDPDQEKELNITKDQREKMKKIHSDAKKANIPLKSSIELKKIELRELMDADSPNKDLIVAKIKEIDAAQTQIKINRTTARIDSRNVLTKEQRDKIQEIRANSHMMWFNGPEADHEGHGKRKMKFKRFMQDKD